MYRWSWNIADVLPRYKINSFIIFYLKNFMILITGASSGLGAALANFYNADGIPLLITGRSKLLLVKVAGKMKGNVQAKPAKLCDPVSVTALLDSLEQVPETVIHCACSGSFGPLEEQEPDAINRLIENNLTTTIFLLRELVKRYRNHKVNVVIVMSTVAQTSKAGESTYSAAEWAVRGLVESVRLELNGFQMKLIAVYPEGMATDFGKQAEQR
jgi:short-subunit dehydrogenase